MDRVRMGGNMKEKKLYMIGNAHLDPVWLWTWQEGYQEVKATFRSALDRMDEYEDFIFTSSSAAFYEWVEQNEPSMFEEIKARVKEGRWVIAGGWWIQPDCNAPCGESFIRQGLYGQQYFLKKLGVTAHTGFNVDSFGHNGMLPQILKKSGLDNYVFMRPGRHEKGLESETFIWKSADESEVTAFRIPFEYCTWPKDMVEHVNRCAGEIKDPKNGIMCFYGVGNHGGGPTKENLDSIHLLNKKEDYPTLVLSTPDEYFKDVKESGRILPTVYGELFHHASGCYSAHSEVKSLNKKAENRLIAAEKLSVVANTLTGIAYPLDKYTEAWKNVLFNQFHDTMAGTSIEQAYVDTRESYGASLHTGAVGLNSAVQSLSWNINIPMEEGMKPIVVFNPNCFADKFEVEMESIALKEGTILVDENENEVPMQLVQSQAACNGRCRICFIAELPSLGYRTYRLLVREKRKEFIQVISTDTTAENKWLKIDFDKETGYINSLLLKKEQAELFSGKAACPTVIEDKSDTWSHGVRVFNKEIGSFKAVSVQRIEHGPVKAMIRVTSEYGCSRMIQDFSIYNELDFVSVKTTMDWHEKWSMLKLMFPMNMNYLRGSYEIPYGVAQREPDGEEYPVQSFMDLEGTNPGMETKMVGLSILNNGKTSCSTAGKTASLTLLRSPMYAHHEPYEPKENLEYVYLDQGISSFTYGLYPHRGSWEDAKTVQRGIQLNQPPIALFETYHKGDLPSTGSFVSVSEENIIVSAIKLAEDGSGDIILRLYETVKRHTMARLSIPALNREIDLTFTPCEIKTLRLPKDETKEIIENSAIEL